MHCLADIARVPSHKLSHTSLSQKFVLLNNQILPCHKYYKPVNNRSHQPLQQPLRRYRQLWSQIKLVDDILCREYTPSPISEKVTVPILPSNLHHAALSKCHDAPGAGHLGPEKSLERLRTQAYWVGMTRDVEQYCQECHTCQKAKPPMPQRAPLVNVPIGRPWQMVAVDILKVPLALISLEITFTLCIS